MDTVGDSPAKLTTQTELAQYYGTASCSVDPASDGNDRSIEAERGICGTGETTSGSPPDRWADAGRANEPDGGECERFCGEIPTRELQWRRHWMA